jgi:hypothetical protein
MKEVQATEEASSPQKRTSSTEHKVHFFIFLFSWAFFSLLDPDLPTTIKAYPCGSGAKNWPK